MAQPDPRLPSTFPTSGDLPNIPTDNTIQGIGAHRAEQAIGNASLQVQTKILIELQVISQLLANLQPSVDDLGQLRKSISYTL